MSNFSAKVKAFKRRLTEYQNALLKIKDSLRNLETQSRSQISIKEKELEEWRQKLEACQQEKNQLDKEIKAKVKELENSQLAHADKQAQINRLLLEHWKSLEPINQQLELERINYRQIRDKLISKLCEPCQLCKEKKQAVRQKDKIIVSLLAIIGTMLILFFLFQVWFMRVAVPKYIRKTKPFKI